MWWHSRQEMRSTPATRTHWWRTNRRFNKFFITKIINTWENLKAIHPWTIMAEDNNNPPSFTPFKELLVEDIIKLIKQSPTKSCKLDQIPTTILKEVIPSISPLFASIVNESMQTGVFPQDLKEALVKPVLKMTILNLIDKNYRPVSNLGVYGQDHWVCSHLSAHPAHIWE